MTSQKLVAYASRKGLAGGIYIICFSSLIASFQLISLQQKTFTVMISGIRISTDMRMVPNSVAMLE